METIRKFGSGLKSHSPTLIILFILFILTLPAIRSLLHPGFFLSDDGEWMIIRLTDFHRSLVSGQIPVRWLARLNHEYGYPVVNFLYPGFLYFGEGIHLLGFNFVNSIKIVLGLSMVFSAVFSYLWLSLIFGRLPAFVGALFYLYAPYHLYDLYTRGSVGEILALAVVPFCLWMVEKKNLLFLGLGYGLLLISHNTVAFLFTPVLALYIVFAYRPFLYAIRYALYAFLLGLGLSAFFWIPAIFDLNHTIFKETHVVNWQAVFSSTQPWRFMDVSTVSVFIACFLLLKRMNKVVFLFWLLFPLSFLFVLPITKIIWQILPLAQIIQFSFRFLFLTVLSGSFLVAFFIKQVPFRFKIVLSIVLVGGLFMFSFPFTQPKSFFDKGEGFYTTNEGTTTVKGEYMPRWVKIFPTDRPKQKVEIITGTGEIKNQFSNSKETSFMVSSLGDSLLQVSTVYFPGWQAWIDGKKTAISYQNENGVIQIPVSRGEHRIEVKFGETLPRIISDIISLLSLLVLAGFLGRKYLFSK